MRQLLGQLLQLRDIGQRLGAFTHAERVVAGELLGARPVFTGPRGLQIGVQSAARLHQRRRPKGLLRQRIQLGALLSAEGVGQRVQQFLDIARVLREELAVLVHEVVEILLGVIAAGVLVQQVVEVVQHLVDPLAVLIGGALQRLLHAGEALVEHLAAEQILDLLVLFAGLAAAPVVVGKLLDGLGRRRRQRLQLKLRKAGVVVQRGGQLLALGQHRLVEQLLDLLQRPV